MKLYSPSANFVKIKKVKAILSLKAHINSGPHSPFLLSVLGEIRCKRWHIMPLTFSQFRKNRSSTDRILLKRYSYCMIIIHVIINNNINNTFLHPNTFNVPPVASTQQLLKTVLRSSGLKAALCCTSYEAHLLFSRKCRKGTRGG